MLLLKTADPLGQICHISFTFHVNSDGLVVVSIGYYIKKDSVDYRSGELRRKCAKMA